MKMNRMMSEAHLVVVLGACGIAALLPSCQAPPENSGSAADATSSDGDLVATGANESGSWTSESLQSAFSASDAELNSALSGQNMLDADFLDRAAKRFAFEFGQKEVESNPVAKNVLTDLDNQPTAFMATFVASAAAGEYAAKTGQAPSVDGVQQSLAASEPDDEGAGLRPPTPDTSLQAPAPTVYGDGSTQNDINGGKGHDRFSPETLAITLNESTAQLTAALDAGDLNLAIEKLTEFRRAEQFTTVLTGVAVDQSPLVSMSPGLPPQAYMPIARRRVAKALNLPFESVRPLRPFYEKRMPPGFNLGILCAVRGAAPTVTETEAPQNSGEPTLYVYLIPSAAHPAGVVLAESTYRSFFEHSPQNGQLASAQAKAETVTPTQRQFDAAESWNTIATDIGMDQGTICPRCDSAYMDLLHTEIQPGAGFPNWYGGSDDECECSYSYHGDSQEYALSCALLEEDANGQVTSESCCDAVGEEGVTCTRTCGPYESTYTRTTDLGVYIRGVPTFYQHVMGEAPFACSPFADRDYLDGCGPVAAAELIAWYDALGWNNLGDDFRNDQDKLKWQGLSETFHEDYLHSNCAPFSSVDGVMASYTTAGEMESGLEDYFNDAGYNFTVNKVKISSGDEDAYFDELKDHVDQNQPVVLVYCSDENICDGGIGLTTTSTAELAVAHIGLITGYREDGGNIIYVNTGWGSGGNEQYSFEAPDGKMWLVFVTPDNNDDDDIWCAGGNPSKWFAPDSSVGCSSCEDEYDDYPILETIVEGHHCHRIGGEEVESGTYSYYVDSTAACLSEGELERLDQTILDLCDQIPWMAGCDDGAPVGLDDGDGSGDDDGILDRIDP